MIYVDGYRQNIGIILLNKSTNQVFWGRRKGESAWQFPQGGIFEQEEQDAAMYRELYEELGLKPCHVKIVAKTKEWLYYDVPSIYLRSANRGYRGQKQIWYLLEFLGSDQDIDVMLTKDHEFDAWKWVEFWYPVEHVIEFKQEVYKKAMQELAKYIKHST
jgi:putative (di)nucleoside polyphosphate hydrolase